MPKLIGIAGRNEAAVTEAAKRYATSTLYTDWRTMLENESIQLFDNGGPNNLHVEPTIMAAELGNATHPLREAARPQPGGVQC
ncbi:MAG: hypothetical protein R3A10_20645 [Caldilineaceae bacterium]